MFSPDFSIKNKEVNVGTIGSKNRPDLKMDYIPIDSNSNGGSSTGSPFPTGLFLLLLLLFAPILYFLQHNYTTKIDTVTEHKTIAPGGALPLTVEDVTYIGPNDQKGKVLSFQTKNPANSKDVDSVNLLYKKGEPLPFDVGSQELLLFDGYSDGKLKVAYTHQKRVTRPKEERSFWDAFATD